MDFTKKELESVLKAIASFNGGIMIPSLRTATEKLAKAYEEIIKNEKTD